MERKRSESNEKSVSDLQKSLLKKLRDYDKNYYADASLYTILLDLCKGNSVEDVFDVLHDVAYDIGCEKELITAFVEKITEQK